MMKRRQMLGLLAACALAFTGSFTGYLRLQAVLPAMPIR